MSQGPDKKMKTKKQNSKKRKENTTIVRWTLLLVVVVDVVSMIDQPSNKLARKKMETKTFLKFYSIVKTTF